MNVVYDIEQKTREKNKYCARFYNKRPERRINTVQGFITKVQTKE